MLNKYEVTVLGAGFAGAVSARILADSGKSVLLLERRNHIGGNAYDLLDKEGVLIHQYGPHIFHTDQPEVFDFLERFGTFSDYQHKVVAKLEEGEMPVPFNLNSLEFAFGLEKGRELGEKLVAHYGAEQKIPILELRNVPEFQEVAEFIYEKVFLYYSMKQWGNKPEDMDPATTARVPIFLSRDNRYFQDKFQGLPKEGYTKLFEKMLDHPNIDLKLNSDILPQLECKEGEIFYSGEKYTGELVFTGQVEELFAQCYGALPYRSLDFLFESFPQEKLLSHGSINYTVSEKFTRITEFKHLTEQILPQVTTTVKEFARDYTGAPEDSPYYPIICDNNKKIYNQYKALSEGFSQLHLLGRLAQYQYFNMDSIVAEVLAYWKERI